MWMCMYEYNSYLEMLKVFAFTFNFYLTLKNIKKTKLINILIHNKNDCKQFKKVW